MGSGTPDESLPIPTTALPDEALRVALRALDAGHAVTIATVLARHGSAPSTPGQKLALIREQGRLAAIGTVGGGAIERIVMERMMDSFRSKDLAPAIHTFRLGPNLGMCCGGSADVLLEPMRPPVAVLLVGAGHVGISTAPLLADLGFKVVLTDAREAMADDEARRALSRPGRLTFLVADHDDPDATVALGSPRSRSAIVVMTHDHQMDQMVIEWGLREQFAFVGGVGSRAKAARTQKRLVNKGFPSTEIERVRMPVGVEIAARRPMEIAVAIAAELVSFRAALEGHRDRPSFVPPSVVPPRAAVTDPHMEEAPVTRRIFDEVPQ
jgi:xanthine dehydrogenase accessory factor